MTTFTATSAVQTLGNGVNNTGDDTFVIGSGTVQSGDVFNGGTGTDTLSMGNNITINFSVATITSMERLVFGSGGSATFNANQFSGSLISPSLAVTGAAGTQAITINNASFFSALSWTFGTWTSGTDTITINGTSGNDIIRGSSQADTITGGAGADTITGGGGNDTINIANGDFVSGEFIDGVGGVDAIVLTSTGTVVDFSGGTVTRIGRLTGSSGNDAVTLSALQWAGFSTALNLAGGANDVLNVVANGDISALGIPTTINNIETGNLTGTTSTDIVTLTGAQFDAIIIGAGTINLGSGLGDTINLTSTSADLNALGAIDARIQGVETISAAAAAVGVTIDLRGQIEGFTITGSGSADTLTGGTGGDIITGGGGGDTINGGAGADTINAGGGGDTINIVTGDFVAGESIDGGAGTGDSLNFTTAGDGTSVDFSSGSISNIETLTALNQGGGNGYNQTFTVTAAQWDAFTTINMNDGTDTLNTRVLGLMDISAGGLTVVNGVETGNLTGSILVDVVKLTGAQLDALLIGSGTINLGVGVTDTINLTSTSFDLNALGAINASIQGVEIIGAPSATTGVTISLSGQNESFNIFGSGFADTITGGGGADEINGGAGADNINAGGGADTINIVTGDFVATELVDGGAGIGDSLNFMSGGDNTSVDFSGGSIINVETLMAFNQGAGDGYNQTFTVSAFQWDSFTTINMNDGDDTLNVQFAGSIDISSGGVTNITAVEIGSLIGSNGGDSIRLTGAQLDAIIVGPGVINLGASLGDTLFLGSTSTDLNSLGAIDASIQGVEGITGVFSGNGVTINLSGQSEGFTIVGSGNADIITGGSGNDTIDGGNDNADIANYSGAWVDYTVTLNGGGSYTITDTRAQSPDGTDTVSNVENFSFTNGTFAANLIVNDAPTDIALSASLVDENSANGTVVGSLSSTDADSSLGDTANYTLIDNAGGRFVVSGTNIVVADGSLLDYETNTSHDVTVRVTDAKGLTYDETFTINVGDVAEGNTIDAGTMDLSQGFRIFGTDGFDYSGRSVSFAGDFNGDGFEDLIIGASGGDGSTNSILGAGEAIVVFGKATPFENIDLAQPLSPSDGFRIFGADSYDSAGYSVSSAGDINGDGFDDLIIGAVAADGASNTFSQVGEAIVIFGKGANFNDINVATMSLDDGFRIFGADNEDRAAWSVSTAGDINGDGFDDLIIGAWGGDGADNSSTNAGEAIVVYGKATPFTDDIDLSIPMSPGEGFRIFGAGSYNQAGWSVSGAGDVNGDGFDDLIVGVRNGNGGTGEAVVVFGGAASFGDIDLSVPLSPTEGFHILGTDISDQLGGSVSSAGDLNGDGFDDLVVGIPGSDGTYNSRTYAGEAIVIFGKSTGFSDIDTSMPLASSTGFRIIGADAFDVLGPVSLAGDINGDGFDDLIVATYNGDGISNTRTGAGEAIVIFGKNTGFTDIDVSTMTPDQGFLIIGADAYDGAGFSVSTAGDINGDGFDDLLVGSWHSGGATDSLTIAGETIVVYGKNFLGDSILIGDQVGSSAAETFLGGLGDNTIVGNGGADIFHGGEGDDTIAVIGTDAFEIDGGRGFDTLRLDSSGDTFDFSLILPAKVTSIEAIDLSGTGDNNLLLSSLDIFDLSDDTFGGLTHFTVLGNADDSVTMLGAGWVDAGINGGNHVYNNGNAQLLIDTDIMIL